MRVRLDVAMVKKYSFPIGGDMSENVAIAVDHEGNPITYKEFIKNGGSAKSLHVLEMDEEFLVVDHMNPLPNSEYDKFKDYFKRS